MVSNIDVLNLHTFFDAITLMYRVTTRLAAQYHRPEDLVAIRAHQTRYAAAAARHDALAMVAINRDLHAAIAEAGRNPYFTTLTLRLLDEGRRILRLYYQSFDDRLPQEFVEEHEAIIAAVAARDIERCDQIARAHANQIVAQIQQLFARDQRQDVPL
jgi:DNA-binding GntR family transcriptional regulator